MAQKENEGGSSLPNGLSVASFTDELRKWGVEAFSGRYNHPFLLLAEEPENPADCINPRTDEVTNHEIRTAAKRKVLHSLDTLVIGLAKSDRNAFDSKVTVGRAKNNDVIIRSPEISKLHAVFAQGDDGVWYVTDMGSANGTLVNSLPVGEKPVEVKSGDKIGFSKENNLVSGDPIKSGDRISFCRYMFEFMDAESFLGLLRKFV